MKPIRIITRKSPLAIKQTELVQAALLAHDKNLQIEIMAISTSADQMLDLKLTEVGGKGLFVKELEQALLDNKADIAVHSVKDMPAVLPEKLKLAACLPREDARDVFVSNQYHSLSELPLECSIGTSSLRRLTQLKAICADWEIKDLRGNVGTRLKKLDEEEFDAIILAAAGLKRLHLEKRINAYLDFNEMLPACGQGALGLEILENSAFENLLNEINDDKTFSAITAERAVVAALGGDCRLPIATFAEFQNAKLYLRALVGDLTGKNIIRAEGMGNEALQLGKSVAKQLIDQGADKILKNI